MSGTVDPFIENVRVALACGADARQALIVAIASLEVSSGADLLATLDARRPELEALFAATPERLALTTPEPELRYEPELARMRLEEGEHELRGRRLYGELLGRWSLMQVMAWEIAGVELSERDARHLEDQGVLTQIADVRVWPLTVTRRVAAAGNGLSAAILAGLATLMNPRMAVKPVSGFARFLGRVQAELDTGRTLDAVLADVRERREVVSGLGRPVLGYDERVVQQWRVMREYGRADGRNVLLAAAIDAWAGEHLGLRLNSAGLQAALLRDLGFSPDASEAFCLLYFLIPTAAHAVYGVERGRVVAPEGT